MRIIYPSRSLDCIEIYDIVFSIHVMMNFRYPSLIWVKRLMVMFLKWNIMLVLREIWRSDRGSDVRVFWGMFWFLWWIWLYHLMLLTLWGNLIRLWIISLSAFLIHKRGNEFDCYVGVKLVLLIKHFLGFLGKLCWGTSMM